eukprot:361816-Chlamydomonas_euryale.AAC.4
MRVYIATEELQVVQGSGEPASIIFRLRLELSEPHPQHKAQRLSSATAASPAVRQMHTSKARLM